MLTAWQDEVELSFRAQNSKKYNPTLVWTVGPKIVLQTDGGVGLLVNRDLQFILQCIKWNPFSKPEGVEVTLMVVVVVFTWLTGLVRYRTDPSAGLGPHRGEVLSRLVVVMFKDSSF